MPRLLRLPPFSPAALTLLLLLLLAGVNALAVAGIVAAHRGAREVALQDLQLQTQVHARALEAVLAALRRELELLVRAPPLRNLLVADPLADPVATRDEARHSLVLFQQAHPAVHALALRDRRGAPLVLLARRGGRVQPLPATSDPPAPIAGRHLFVAQLPVAGRGRERGLLEVWIAPDLLLGAVAPALGGRLELRQSSAAPSAEAADRLVVRAAVREPLWTPPIAWTLERGEREGRLLAPVTALAARYRRTALLNIGVMLLTLLLGLLAFRQARRGAALAAENRQQARLRELERQVLHAERLASLGRLAAGVAHEVNNPLAGMASYLSLLEEDLAAGEVERARSLVSRVREGLSRVAGVTRQMLAFSDPGRTAKEALDLRCPLGETVEFVRRHPSFRGIELRLRLPAAPVTVRGSTTTLGQLFLNLLLNAAQSQPGGGAVSIDCRILGGRAQVTVADRGPGLSPEVMAHLFEPFFSTRGSTGLGLAACRGIAADHGGTLRAANRPEGGAELVLELPLASTTPTGAEGAEGADGADGADRGGATAPGGSAGGDAAAAASAAARPAAGIEAGPNPGVRDGTAGKRAVRAGSRPGAGGRNWR